MNYKEQIKFLEKMLENAYLGRLQAEISNRRLMALTISSRGKESELYNGKLGEERKKIEEFEGLIRTIKGLVNDIKEGTFKLE